MNSTRSTDFLTPKSEMSNIFRNAVLNLAGCHDFARPLVNSGRLSLPATYQDTPLNSADALNGPERTRPGSPCPDAPLDNGFLLDQLSSGFQLLAINTPVPAQDLGLPVLHIKEAPHTIKERYLGDAPQAIYLIRPDQHVAGRWPVFDPQTLQNALNRAMGLEPGR